MIFYLNREKYISFRNYEWFTFGALISLGACHEEIESAVILYSVQRLIDVHVVCSAAYNLIFFLTSTNNALVPCSEVLKKYIFILPTLEELPKFCIPKISGHLFQNKCKIQVHVVYHIVYNFRLQHNCTTWDARRNIQIKLYMPLLSEPFFHTVLNILKIFGSSRLHLYNTHLLVTAIIVSLQHHRKHRFFIVVSVDFGNYCFCRFGVRCISFIIRMWCAYILSLCHDLGRSST